MNPKPLNPKPIKAIMAVSMFFSIIPIKPQSIPYNPYIRHYSSFHFLSHSLVVLGVSWQKHALTSCHTRVLQAPEARPLGVVVILGKEEVLKQGGGKEPGSEMGLGFRVLGFHSE